MSTSGHDAPTDLELVCDIALDWAGEYGFSDPKRATEVHEAVERLCPDLYAQAEKEHKG